MNPKVIKAASDFFSKNPKENQVWATEDGMVFRPSNKSDYINHKMASKLNGSEIKRADLASKKDAGPKVDDLSPEEIEAKKAAEQKAKDNEIKEASDEVESLKITLKKAEDIVKEAEADIAVKSTQKKIKTLNAAKNNAEQVKIALEEAEKELKQLTDK